MGDGPTLALLVLKTARLDECRAFYAALGLEFVEERHGRGPTHFAAPLGGGVFELYPLLKEGDPPSGSLSASAAEMRLGIAVTRFDETLARLTTLGLGEVGPPRETEWGPRAIVRDPDGRVVELSPR